MKTKLKKRMKKFIVFICCIVLISSANLFSQEKLIFDTDFGGDADDLGALAMLHQFVERDECELLAIMSWSVEKYTVSAIDAVNRFYNHPDIPIGTRKDSTSYVEWSYNKPIADALNHQLKYEDACDATVLYRKLLAQNEDSSIVIVTVGPLKNIENLLKSQADSISELSGKELIDKKVKKFVIMGGRYPEGKNEWNFDGGMAGVTKYVVENLNIPVVFTGFELGVQIKTGEVFNQLDHKHPLYIGFLHFSRSAPWMKQYYKGKIFDNSTFDQTAVLYAVRNGEGLYWEKSKAGVCLPDEKGGNKWKEVKNGNHHYLITIMEKEKIEEEIEKFMLGKF